MFRTTPIVVMYFNKPNLTLRCLRSIVDAGYPSELVICFNNGSSMETSNRVIQSFPNFSHITISDNLGFSGGFNRALQGAFSLGAGSVFFLTNDTIITPNACEEIVKIALTTGAGMVAPRINYLSNREMIDSIGAFFDRVNICPQHYHELDLPIRLDPVKDYIPGTAVWISEEAFQSLGGVDESYHMYLEDLDLCFRAHQKGIQLARAYASIIYHGVGQTCHKKPLYTTYYFQRNRILFCKRFLRGTELISAMEKIKADLDRFEQYWMKKGDLNRLNLLKEVRCEFSLMKD